MTTDLAIFESGAVIEMPKSTRERIDELVNEAALYTEIKSASAASNATQVQADLADIRKEIEKARKTLKEPLIEKGRQIDAIANEAKEKITEEERRLSRMIGDFHALENAKLLAQQQAQATDDERNKLKNNQLAEAGSLEEHQQIRESWSSEASTMVLPTTTLAKGQSIKTDWEITITNIWLLAKAHPSCVNITPRIADIKELLRNGVTVAGVNAQKINKSVTK